MRRPLAASAPAKYGLFEKKGRDVQRVDSIPYDRKAAMMMAAALRRQGRSVYARKVPA